MFTNYRKLMSFVFILIYITIVLIQFNTKVFSVTIEGIKKFHLFIEWEYIHTEIKKFRTQAMLVFSAVVNTLRNSKYLFYQLWSVPKNWNNFTHVRKC